MTELKPCSVCGTPTRSKYGVCQRTKECLKVCRRAYNEEHREHNRAYKKAYRASHRKEISAYTRTPKVRAVANARRRLRYATEPEFADQKRKRALAFHWSHREECNARARASHAAHREERNAKRRTGGILGIRVHNRRGRNHGMWGGGRMTWCAICGAETKWRAPGHIKLYASRTGFRCSAHKGVRIKDEDYDPVTQLQTRGGTCRVCGEPTTGKYGVCYRTEECRRTIDRLRKRKGVGHENKSEEGSK